jgi:ribosome-binding factor A
MASRRQRQVAELLHQEISQLIQYRTQDPRLGFITVTGVEVSPDLTQAQVYITVLGDESDLESTFEGLASATGFFRRELGQSLSLRYIPELEFKHDTSLERAMRIEALLDQIEEAREEDQESENASEVEPD